MDKSTVVVIPSMHGFHEGHSSYNYEALFQVVNRFEPDFVGVEIRPEDIGCDEGYLKRNYPYEMVELSKRFINQCFGFDWLHDDIKGQSIPENYWEEISEYKRIEREFGSDSNFKSEILDGIRSQQMELLISATHESLSDGRYDKIIKQYYQVFDDLVRSTKYEFLSEHWIRRNQEIGKNIVDFIQTHPGKRIALVTGANHQVYIFEILNNYFGDGEIRYVLPKR